MKYNIDKDLLPNNIEDLTNEETNTEMSTITSQETPPEEKEHRFFKPKKKKLWRNMMITFSICIAAAGSFFIFANNYDIPLPFDEYRMSAELIPSAVITNEDGKILWRDLEYAISNGIVSKDYDNVINVLVQAYEGINNISERSTGRTINRNGEDVRIVYYYYSKTLWTSLCANPDSQEYSESGTSTGTDIYGDRYQSADYKPQMIEIYYLPVKTIYDNIDQLSDEEYDRLRDNHILVWSGII